MTEKKDFQVLISLPKSTYELLGAHAKRENRRMGEMARILLEKVLTPAPVSNPTPGTVLFSADGLQSTLRDIVRGLLVDEGVVPPKKTT